LWGDDQTKSQLEEKRKSRKKRRAVLGTCKARCRKTEFVIFWDGNRGGGGGENGGSEGKSYARGTKKQAIRWHHQGLRGGGVPKAQELKIWVFAKKRETGTEVDCADFYVAKNKTGGLH